MAKPGNKYILGHSGRRNLEPREYVEYTFNCRNCGDEFKSTSKRAKYCDLCKGPRPCGCGCGGLTKDRQQEFIEGHQPPEKLYCRECHSQFESLNHRQKYCPACKWARSLTEKSAAEALAAILPPSPENPPEQIPLQ